MRICQINWNYFTTYIDLTFLTFYLVGLIFPGFQFIHSRIDSVQMLKDSKQH